MYDQCVASGLLVEWGLVSVQFWVREQDLQRETERLERRDRLNCTNLDLILMISLHFSPPKETVVLESSVSLKYL